MKQYKIYCTEEQTKKAIELDAPIGVLYDKVDYQQKIPTVRIKGEFVNYDYFVPTTQEMIGWLEEQGIMVSILYGYEVSDKWGFDLDSEEYIDYKSGVFDSRKEATLAAIDATLEYLSNNKK